MTVDNVDISKVIMEVIPAHPTDYLRVVNRNMVRLLHSEDEASLEIPTLRERAKTFVNRDRYISIFSKRESTDG